MSVTGAVYPAPFFSGLKGKALLFSLSLNGLREDFNILTPLRKFWHLTDSETGPSPERSNASMDFEVPKLQ